MRFLEVLRGISRLELYDGVQSDNQLGQTKVKDLRLPALGDEDAGTLDVAMDSAIAVGGLERLGKLDGEVEQRVHR